ncbi:helix-turn-helix domain-containing protein [Thomasclavelia sp.]
MVKSVKKCPPYHLISAAADGDERAIDKLLLFYDAYISKSSLRPLYDEYGNIYVAVDMELKGRIRSAIMEMLQSFEVKIK